MKSLLLPFGLLVAVSLSACNKPAEVATDPAPAPAPPAPASGLASPSSDPLVDRCTKEVETMYAVPRSSISTEPMKAVADGFGIAGSVDKGAEGMKAYLCVFDGNKTFSHVEAMTQDGE